MPAPSRPARLLPALVLLLVALLTGCVADAPAELVDPPEAPPVAAPVVEVPPTPEPPLDPIVVDWGARRELEPTTLVDGRTIQPCPGDGPFLCVTDKDGVQVGAIELATWPASGGEDDLDAWLRGHVVTFVDTMREDRLVGCGPDFRLDLAGIPVLREVDGHRAITYRYVVTRGGTELERGVTTLVRRDAELLGISAIAYDPAGCVGTEGGEFTPAGLETFEPALDAIIRGSRLP